MTATLRLQYEQLFQSRVTGRKIQGSQLIFDGYSYLFYKPNRSSTCVDPIPDSREFKLTLFSILIRSTVSDGRAVPHLVEALRCKPQSRGFDSQWFHLKFSLTRSLCRAMTVGLTQPLTEMSTRNISWRVKAAGA